MFLRRHPRLLFMIDEELMGFFLNIYTRVEKRKMRSNPFLITSVKSCGRSEEEYQLNNYDNIPKNKWIISRQNALAPEYDAKQNGITIFILPKQQPLNIIIFVNERLHGALPPTLSRASIKNNLNSYLKNICTRTIYGILLKCRKNKEMTEAI